MDERDERLGQTEGAQGRTPGRRAAGARDVVSGGRSSAERELQERGATEREFTEDREYSDDERLEMFRASMYQSVLPDLPPRAGYHTIWLTTTNARDSLSARMRMGYQLALLEDCPSWEGLSVKSGDVAGAIGVNEMVGAYIPLRLYHLYMKEAHHDAPLRDEEKLRAVVSDLQQQAAAMGSRVDAGDGMTELAKRASRVPVFRD